MIISTTHNSISREQMKEAILRSGYLLEQRVATSLVKAGYNVKPNRRFIDPETGKTREYDVFAAKDIAVYRTGSHGIFPTLVCECKNNQQPIAFFVEQKEIFVPSEDEVRVSGMPSKIWQHGEYISVQEFTKVESFHHYCRPEVPVATQCCTFEMKKDKSSWMASHSEDLYETFRTLSKALEYEIDEDFKNMSQFFVDEETGNEFMDLSFYYPVVIFQGDIYAAHLEQKLNLKKREHMQFNPYFFSFYNNEVITYHIDVISEEYLSSYLKIIDQEMITIKKILQQQKQNVLLSMDKIVEECKGLKKKPKTYRKYLEIEI